MKSKLLFQTIILVLAILAGSCKNCSKKEVITPLKTTKRPNVVIIFLDDSGYADFNPFGQKSIPTPNVQKLADEGTIFTNFHVPQAICSASRSALLTGCYPGRTKVFGAHGPKARGLETSFPTIGELFKSDGYKTALFGKWHCGDQPDTRSHARGFDETCGLMYSNDMWKHHPENPEYWGKYPIQFWENGAVTIEDVDIADQKMLTKWYTEHAVDFINRNSEDPFLLYVPHSMPHVPIFCSEEFEGKSGVGLFGDVTMELDWSVGEITKALKENGLEENTIVIFSSDNGPWTAYGNHAGNTPFREAKATSFEGGTRSACIIKYPKHVMANHTSNKAFYSIDLLPSLCQLTGVPLPDSEIDGKNVWPLIAGEEGAVNPQDYYAISTGNTLESIMSGDGKWKLHIPHSYRTLVTPGVDGAAGKYETRNIELALFDMVNDPYESSNVTEKYPEMTHKLMEYANSHKEYFYKSD
jgi:arylsulfatase A-like enzyme